MDEAERAFYLKLYELLNRDRDAFALCVDLIYCGHLWDDLIDKDKVRTDEEINDCFTAMLGRVPRNPFFQRHVQDLAPLMMSAILQWKDANKLEANGDENERAMAYMLRNALLQVAAYCIYLKGGDELYSVAGEQFQRMCSKDIHSLYEAFAKEMGYA
jgi:hypothetical protein